MKSDLGSIVGAIIGFVIFIISSIVLYLILDNYYKNFYYTANSVANQVRNIVGENIKFLNNQTNYSSPYLIIYNNGNKALDLSCFRLYVNGYFSPFSVANQVRNIVGENIKFLNNQTNYSSPYLIIYNNGNKALDLSCFQLYVNGYFSSFNYSINYLYPSNLFLPGENATIYFNNNYLVNNSWNYIILVSCYGVKFQTLIYAR